MNKLFKSFLRRFILAFFDDILVYSKNWPSHLSQFAIVLHILQENQFVVNKKKCSFGRRHIDYLGHVISQNGVAVDPNKISSIVHRPIPRNVKGVRGFLGLTGYYRKFIANFGKIAKPLTELTEKEGFHWNAKVNVAFEELKRVVTTAPVLVYPNFYLPFEIECDASERGVGALLMRQQRPVAYFSKAFFWFQYI